MNTRVVSLALACLLLVPVVAGALDYLEIRRQAPVYQEPSTRSQKLATLDPDEREGPYLVRLASEEKQKGYYHVRLPGRTDTGWVYKTYVRRYRGEHPSYVPYKRTLYRHWIDEDGNCRNTRQEVLIRDAVGRVIYQDEDKCKVARAVWNDPYSGKTFNEPGEVDVDHFVPLKNAHESGAWTWSAQRKKEYANYLADATHLLAVSASENRRKADKGPDQYLPPNAVYHCDYVRTWTRIKRDWELEMTEPEGAAVQRVLDRCP